MSRRRTIAIGAGIAAAGAALGRRRTMRVPTDPFDPNAIRAETAAARTAEIIAKPRVRRLDLAQTYAPAISTAVDPLLHGRRYFPRMLDDIAAATNHVHLLIYGYKSGDIGETFLTALSDKVAAGVEVRLAVDAIGSEVDFGSKALFRRLREAGVEIVAHDGIVVLRSGELGTRKFKAHGEDLLHFDHRKMAVIDGRVGYVGGSGIEDHYNDERFYDVMCRVEGPIVAQLQSVFLLSWRHHGGGAPTDPSLAEYFPPDALRVPADAGFHTPTTVLWNVPGTGHHPISDAIEQALDDAADEIHIVNPYISNRAILERIHQAAWREGAPDRPRQADATVSGRRVPALVRPAHRCRRGDPAPSRDGPRQGPADRRAGPHRRLQPRRPLAVPQRRARPAVRRPGGRRAHRAEHLRRIAGDVHPGDRCHGRQAASLERGDGSGVAAAVVAPAAAAHTCQPP
jgi:hypothetical protein